MIKIILKPTSNGVIKKIRDNNFNGAGSEYEKTSVYSFDMNGLDVSKRFLEDMMIDLNLEVGNQYETNYLHLKEDWGPKYSPTLDEVQRKIKSLKNQLNELEIIEEKLKNGR